MVEKLAGLPTPTRQDEPGEMTEGDGPGEADQTPSVFEEGGQWAQRAAPVFGGAPVGGYEPGKGPVPVHSLREEDEVPPALDAHLRPHDGSDAVLLGSLEEPRDAVQPVPIR